MKGSRHFIKRKDLNPILKDVLIAEHQERCKKIIVLALQGEVATIEVVTTEVVTTEVVTEVVVTVAIVDGKIKESLGSP